MSQPDPVLAAFDQVESFEKQRRKLPDLRLYCTKVLGVRFTVGGTHDYCPMHKGKSGQSFSIDDRYQRWHCFSDCAEGAASVSGDVWELHWRCFDFPTKQAALEHLLSLNLPAVGPANTDISPQLPKRRERPGPAIPPDERLIRGVEYGLRGFGCAELRSRSPVREPSAKIFAELLLQLPPEARTSHLPIPPWAR